MNLLRYYILLTCIFPEYSPYQFRALSSCPYQYQIHSPFLQSKSTAPVYFQYPVLPSLHRWAHLLYLWYLVTVTWPAAWYKHTSSSFCWVSLTLATPAWILTLSLTLTMSQSSSLTLILIAIPSEMYSSPTPKTRVSSLIKVLLGGSPTASNF